MKKIALILMLITTIPTYATTMCAQNDTVVVVLDPTLSGDRGYNLSNGNWSFITKSYAIYGETKIENSKCFYRITHPFIIPWRFHTNTTSVGGCADSVAVAFGNGIELRRSIFSSIAN